MALKVTALAGGVGGAKLAHGLAAVLPASDLTVIVNTGDDFVHLGLHISPDVDTVMYTLAGLAHPQRGWGRDDETWHALDVLQQLGGDDWFRLGDHDLGLHLFRTEQMRHGARLSEVTRSVAAALDVPVAILPMSDDPVRTMVQTPEGELPFQVYFVQKQCQPIVTGFRFDGISVAKPSPGVMEALEEADLVVLCPSNPWVSLDPILALQGVRTALTSKKVVAISPIIAGKTVKGPAAAMFADLGIPPSALAVARHYEDILTAFVIDEKDSALEPEVRRLGVDVLVEDTIMRSTGDRIRLAEAVLPFAQGGTAR